LPSDRLLILFEKLEAKDDPKKERSEWDPERSCVDERLRGKKRGSFGIPLLSICQFNDPLRSA